MPILKKKNKSVLPTEKELATLDGSVDELSRQTKQLLKGFGEPAPVKKNSSKDVAPSKTSVGSGTKKSSVPLKKSSARSFDIIHTPSKKKLSSHLKTRPPEETPELLPTHAGLSYNEEPAEKPVSHQTPAIVHSHASGALHIVARSDDEAEEKENRAHEDTSHKETNLVSEKPAEELKETTVAVQSFSFNDKKEADLQEPAEEKEAAPIPQENRIEEPDSEDKKDDKKEADSPLTGQTYGNSSTHSSLEPKGYEPVENQEFPTVFDTSEYHVELHDWSKLEHKGNAAWYTLALLVALAAVMAYFILSGQDIPLIGM